jgi:hypothetical protein
MQYNVPLQQALERASDASLRVATDAVADVIGLWAALREWSDAHDGLEIGGKAMLQSRLASSSKRESVTGHKDLSSMSEKIMVVAACTEEISALADKIVNAGAGTGAWSDLKAGARQGKHEMGRLRIEAPQLGSIGG